MRTEALLFALTRRDDFKKRVERVRLVKGVRAAKTAVSAPNLELAHSAVGNSVRR